MPTRSSEHIMRLININSSLLTAIAIPLKVLAYLCYEFRQKNKQSIVFCSYQNRTYNFNSKYLFQYLYGKGYKCTFVLDDKVLRAKLNKSYNNAFISSRSVFGLKTILLARIWITSTGMPIRIPFANRKRTIINLWHGVPLKKVGILEQNISVTRKMIMMFIYKNNYSLICITSEHLRELYAKSFLCEERNIRVFGQPQNDYLLKSSYNYSRCKLEKLLGIHPIRKHNILYCPTYRDSKNTLIFPFSDFDVFNLKKYLERNDMAIYLRLHPLDTLHFRYIGGPIRLLSSDMVPDIMSVLGAFDLLITDYSSLYIDFLLLNRPMIFLPFDIKEYSDSRGLNFDYHDVTPGPKPTTQSEFMQEIELLLKDEDYYGLERKAVCEYFHQVYGNSNQLINKYIDNLD